MDYKIDLKLLRELSKATSPESDWNLDLTKRPDGQAIKLTHFFDGFNPSGSFVYMSAGTHVSIFQLEQIKKRQAFAIDPLPAQYYTEENIAYVSNQVNSNPLHKFLHITDVEAIEYFKSDPVQVVYMFNSYASIESSVAILKQGGFLICNDWLGQVSKARASGLLTPIAVITGDDGLKEEEIELYLNDPKNYFNDDGQQKLINTSDLVVFKKS